MEHSRVEPSIGNKKNRFVVLPNIESTKVNNNKYDSEE